jgi:hypothetical protein
VDGGEGETARPGRVGSLSKLGGRQSRTCHLPARPIACRDPSSPSANLQGSCQQLATSLKSHSTVHAYCQGIIFIFYYFFSLLYNPICIDVSPSPFLNPSGMRCELAPVIARPSSPVYHAANSFVCIRSYKANNRRDYSPTCSLTSPCLDWSSTEHVELARLAVSRIAAERLALLACSGKKQPIDLAGVAYHPPTMPPLALPSVAIGGTLGD